MAMYFNLLITRSSGLRAIAKLMRMFNVGTVAAIYDATLNVWYMVLSVFVIRINLQHYNALNVDGLPLYLHAIINKMSVAL